jgi:hypothetical protein
MDTKKISFFAGILFVLLTGCKANTKLVYNPQAPRLAPLPESTQMRIVLPEERLGKDSTQALAFYRQGVRPFESCTYNDILKVVTDQARLVGAHTVRIRKILPPDLNSSCFRMEAVFYR